MSGGWRTWRHRTAVSHCHATCEGCGKKVLAVYDDGLAAFDVDRVTYTEDVHTGDRIGALTAMLVPHRCPETQAGMRLFLGMDPASEPPSEAPRRTRCGHAPHATECRYRDSEGPCTCDRRAVTPVPEGR